MIAKEAVAQTVKETGKLGFKDGRNWMTSTDSFSRKLFKCNCLYVSVNTSVSSSTLWGVSKQLESDCHSQKEIIPRTELGNSDTGQVGPVNSTRVFNTQPTLVTPASSNSPTSGQACSGDSEELPLKKRK